MKFYNASSVIPKIKTQAAGFVCPASRIKRVPLHNLYIDISQMNCALVSGFYPEQLGQSLAITPCSIHSFSDLDQYRKDVILALATMASNTVGANNPESFSPDSVAYQNKVLAVKHDLLHSHHMLLTFKAHASHFLSSVNSAGESDGGTSMFLYRDDITISGTVAELFSILEHIFTHANILLHGHSDINSETLQLEL